MKLKYLLMLLGVCAFCACSDDEGNYNYAEINKVTIADTDLEAGKRYTKIAFVNKLTFDPKIESSLGLNNENDYTYEWKLLPKGTDFKNIEDVENCTISRERKLDVLVTQEPGDYSGFFIVKDKKTDVCWTTPFLLTVKSTTSEGWMVLCEENGKARLDVISNVEEDEDLVARNIWQEKNFEAGMPQRIIYNYGMYGTEVSLLITDKGTYKLDKEMCPSEATDLKWSFAESVQPIHLLSSAISTRSPTSYWVVVDHNKDVYKINLYEDGSLFDYPINKYRGIRFNAAPFVGIGISTDNWFETSPAMLYDEDNNQFMLLEEGEENLTKMNFEDESLFSSQTERDMVYMESAKSGIIYSLLKDPATGQFYFYGISMTGWSDTDWETWETVFVACNEQMYYGEVSGEGLSEAGLFAFHHRYPYLFYASGNIVYQFDLRYPETPAKPVLKFPGEEIAIIKFNPFISWTQYTDWEAERGYQLIVGTNVKNKAESECGVIRMYNVPDLMGALEQKKEHTELGKIVDITYRERGN